MSPEQAKELEDDLIDLLAAVDGKTDLLRLVMSIVKDVRVVADEIHNAKLSATVFDMKDEETKGAEQDATAGSVEKLMTLPKLDTINGTLAQLKVAALDFVLKSRREYVKDLSTPELADICRTLLDELLAQEQAVFHLVSLMIASKYDASYLN